MNQKRLLCVAVFAVATLAVLAIARVNVVHAQTGGEAGYGGTGGGGGNGGYGGGGGNGYGGGGGGGGFGSGSGGIAAYGDYVYVLQQETLYQYAAYDLAFVKKIDLRAAGGKNRIVRLGGGGGRGGEGGQRDAGGEG
jgi:hypothetical protein